MRTVAVSSSGRVEVEPDFVTVRVGIHVLRDEAVHAWRNASQLTDKLVHKLDALDIDTERDVQTSQLTLREKINWKTDKRIGFTAASQMSVRVRALERAGDIIGGIVEVGGDETRISMAGFGADDLAGEKKKARIKAVANMRAKAETLAHENNAALGAPLSLHDGVAPRREQYRRHANMSYSESAPMSAAAASMPVLTGTLFVESTVSGVYELVLGDK